MCLKYFCDEQFEKKCKDRVVYYDNILEKTGKIKKM